ncbi:hypothetical protein Pmani_039669 [Petrolisthes manimaculis]|uniref:Uncharacterized protein n=1 Tax=Petrolisthes manimaculis TaxID=1843537 RepID=A0AAE1NC37_9EUCA|nr:hypothetical protein Pmani_039669 [Petrolisthes manimaculis]
MDPLYDSRTLLHLVHNSHRAILVFHFYLVLSSNQVPSSNQVLSPEWFVLVYLVHSHRGFHKVFILPSINKDPRVTIPHRWYLVFSSLDKFIQVLQYSLVSSLVLSLHSQVFQVNLVDSQDNMNLVPIIHKTLKGQQTNSILINNNLSGQ